MNKFEKNLVKTNTSIKETRAKRVSFSLKIAQEELVNSLRRKVIECENVIEDLTDLSPTQTTSLNYKNIVDNDWVTKMQKAKVDVALLKEELRIAKETYDEWFSDIKE